MLLARLLHLHPEASLTEHFNILLVQVHSAGNFAGLHHQCIRRKCTKAGLILVNGTERAIVGDKQFQVITILISRLRACFMYPSKLSLMLRRIRRVGGGRTHIFFLSMQCSSHSRIPHEVSSNWKLFGKVSYCHSYVRGFP